MIEVVVISSLYNNYQKYITRPLHSHLWILAQSSLLIAAGLIFTRFSNLILRVVFGRVLGPEDLGTLAALWSLITLLGTISVSGITPMITRFVALYDTEERHELTRGVIEESICWVVMVSCLAATGAYIAAPIIVSKWFDNSISENLLRSVLIGVPAWSLLLWSSACFRGFSQTVPTILTRDIARNLLALCGLLVLWCLSALDLEYGLWLYIAPAVAAALLGFLGFYPFYTQLLSRTEFRQTDRKVWFECAWPLTLSMLLQNASGRSIDVLLLSFFATQFEVGIYVAALAIAGLAGMALQCVNYLALPLFSSELGTARHKYFSVSRTLIFELTLPIILVLSLWPNLSIDFLFGEKFTTSITVIPILLAGSVISNYFGPVGQLLIADNRTRWHLAADIASIIVFLAISVALVSAWGVIGMAIARMFSQITFNLMVSWPLFNEGKLVFFEWRMIKTALGFTAIAITLKILSQFSSTHLPIRELWGDIAVILIVLIVSYAWFLINRPKMAI